MSVLDCLEQAREIISAEGGGGILWSSVTTQLHLTNSTLTKKLLNMLVQHGFSVDEVVGTADHLIIAPKHYRLGFLGLGELIHSHEETDMRVKQLYFLFFAFTN